MDILISSNLERLLYLKTGCEKTAAYMKALNECGRYEIDAAPKASIDADFTGYYCDEDGTADVIRRTFAEHHYVVDPHTAVGLSAAEQYIAATGDTTKMVVDSTASPYKFVLTGDFNAVPDSDSIKQILSTGESLGTVDLTADIPDSFHGFGRENFTPVKIDYIFSNLPSDPAESYKVSDDDSCGHYYSDHNALCAFVEI